MFAILNNLFKKLKPKLDRRVYNELSGMTDRTLKDMGISRCDIYNIASGGNIYRKYGDL